MSTNIDDAFILVGFFSDRAVRARDVVAGQYLGMGALTCAAMLLALLAYALPARDVGLLGCLPLAIGLYRLWRNWRGSGDDIQAGQRPAAAGALATILSVASVTIANGGDNIAVYVPLFARSSGPAALLTCLVFAGLVAVWCFAGHWLVSHRRTGAFIKSWGRRLMPFVLIGLGVRILLTSGVTAGL